ncbi:gamma-glutamyl-gamma-aminobutyrate hydrolase family protein, partial [[Clostridium] innocuum]|nr:gamma-glutamyl-gamma-aminobutyrate hydrolase family protein [[Clostridium] innocuum]
MKVLAVLMRIEKLDHAWKWFINKPYVDRVEALGWSLYPICSMAGIASALQVCDALLLPGGYDVQSYYMKEDRNEHVTTYAQPMDHLEFQVIDAFMCHEKPILGICRGMQTLNVYAGGTLLQHIDTQTHAPKQLHTVHSSSRSV